MANYEGLEESQIPVEGTNYPAGSFINFETMTPRDQRRFESGELEHLVEAVPDEYADRLSYGDADSEFGVFIAEHEAEAHALEQYGHHVIPREQELELLSQSSEHHANYQRAVKEAGLDRRPALEAMHPDNRERVPNDVLYGSEQRTGVPHNRGPEQAEPDGEGYDEQDEPASRPAPGSGSSNRQEAEAQTVGPEAQ